MLNFSTLAAIETREAGVRTIDWILARYSLKISRFDGFTQSNFIGEESASSQLFKDFSGCFDLIPVLVDGGEGGKTRESRNPPSMIS